jgi:hypothetical protein
MENTDFWTTILPHHEIVLEHNRRHASKIDHKAQHILDNRCQRAATVSRIGANTGKQPRLQQPKD